MCFSDGLCWQYGNTLGSDTPLLFFSWTRLRKLLTAWLVTLVAPGSEWWRAGTGLSPGLVVKPSWRHEGGTLPSVRPATFGKRKCKRGVHGWLTKTSFTSACNGRKTPAIQWRRAGQRASCWGTPTRFDFETSEYLQFSDCRLSYRLYRDFDTFLRLEKVRRFSWGCFVNQVHCKRLDSIKKWSNELPRIVFLFTQQSTRRLEEKMKNCNNSSNCIKPISIPSMRPMLRSVRPCGTFHSIGEKQTRTCESMSLVCCILLAEIKGKSQIFCSLLCVTELQRGDASYWRASAWSMVPSVRLQGTNNNPMAPQSAAHQWGQCERNTGLSHMWVPQTDGERLVIQPVMKWTFYVRLCSRVGSACRALGPEHISMSV